MIQLGPIAIHVESLLIGIALGVALPIVVDRYVFRPLATWLEQVERRWNGRLRAR